ncbi:class I SAM-dependent methyltransferase [Vibrio sp. B1FLJ16]|uniref:class I SAM-dependent methyltransferase n=1 Tax=Vibrio sp. B1FLJ16 TaxID=2751178 RepID=UPI0015F58A21|nr:class I SAM-dependent methyltransferase [Vibrio sp. B1FLJ16]CAD7818893.1 ubiE/COQ5 methyltransferase family [Vibrio sp. B1FLJ16]CAD7819747.1 ubiE/COQ5 methyltransferase family [Vibrio sp. B1FLJ16]CAE6936523.1 ubiE/COQ5 methyltransferase family [Vibrio sp. B1FLJ16]CAE6940358.1 ubiE/COQ5 methyltransferase family [Vibrio sp. B1FLJ16]
MLNTIDSNANQATVNLSNTVNYDTIKEKQRATWGSGDYGQIGVTLQITGEQLCEAMDVKAGQSVLDIAAGNGNVTLAAARRFCNVVSTDYVEALLVKSKQRAQAEGLDVSFQFADAESLPFSENSFDNVVSTFGVMFTPNQAQSAAELIRVCKPNGKIGLVNWTPEGFVGQLFKLIGSYIAPPAGVKSPALWGTRDFIDQQFKSQASEITYRLREFNFRYHSPQHFIDLFRSYYGPVHKAFAALGETQAADLERGIHALIARFNRDQTGGMVVPSEYLEIVIQKA